MLAEEGTLSVSNNWIKSGWRNSHEGSGFGGGVTVAGAFIIGTLPGFADAANQDFHLANGSAAINAGTGLLADVLPANNVMRQYVKHQLSQARPVSGALDLGAYEFAAAAPLQILTGTLPNGVRGRFYNQPLQATGGSGSYLWSITQGTLPPGMWLDAANGVIHGKAARRGSWTFQITVQDAQNPSDISGPAVMNLNVSLFSGTN
jgi:hypothetical protein